MDADHSPRRVELKRQISLLQQDELRLRWLISSKFILEKLKEQARMDLDSVLKNLREAGYELSRLEREQ